MAKRKVMKAKPRRSTGSLTRRKANAAYRRANQGRVEAVESAIDKAIAEHAKLREAISNKIERKIAAAEARERRATRRRR